MRVVSSMRIKKKIQGELIGLFPDIDFSFYENMDEAEVEIQTADILLTYGEDLTNSIIEKAKSLKWIMVMSAGLDKMPLHIINKKGIVVTNARGIHKTPMAEYTIAMMLQVSRNVKDLIRNESNEVWDRRVRMNELSNKSVTILGIGSIGQEVARLAKAFNMRTIGVNKDGREIDYVDKVYKITKIGEAIGEADFVISVLPSTPETKGLLTKELFEKMKNTAVFINIGRGDLYEEHILMDILENGEIAHAVLDVFESEPLRKGHPFWQMDNVTVTPHLSGISSKYQERGFEIFKSNLVAFIEGEKDLINKIDLLRGY